MFVGAREVKYTNEAGLDEIQPGNEALWRCGVYIPPKVENHILASVLAVKRTLPGLVLLFFRRS